MPSPRRCSTELNSCGLRHTQVLSLDSAEEGIRKLQPLACHTCAARVSVAKYSPAHTSIQWTTEASRTCREMTAPVTVGCGGYLLRCEALDRTVDEAVARGEITMTTRSEPAVAPLTAAKDRHSAPVTAVHGQSVRSTYTSVENP